MTPPTPLKVSVAPISSGATAWTERSKKLLRRRGIRVDEARGEIVISHHADIPCRRRGRDRAAPDAAARAAGPRGDRLDALGREGGLDRGDVRAARGGRRVRRGGADARRRGGAAGGRDPPAHRSTGQV